MRDIYVRVLGRCAVTVDGRPVTLTPTATVLLLRLVVASGEPVLARDLYRDVWGGRRGTPLNQLERAQVQKRILELRVALDPANRGEDSKLIETIRGSHTAYRLRLARAKVDAHHFSDSLDAAGADDTEASNELRRRALALWAGPALFDAAEHEFAAAEIRRLDALRRRATVDLIKGYQRVGALDDALRTTRVAQQMWPDDDTFATIATTIVGSWTSERRRILRLELRRSDSILTIVPGDLFEQEDAHIAVGFCDTFDTATDDNRIINKGSQQGQLLERLYGGQRDRLDRDLRAALASVPRAMVEQRRDKRHGKLVRYPIGTVAVLPRSDRRIFAVAYSRMGNDLIAQSTVEQLTLSLDRLWDALYRHGQRLPLAVPVFGSGLSRIDTVEYSELVELIVRSFADRTRRQIVSSELRIVIPPDHVPRLRLPDLSGLAAD